MTQIVQRQIAQKVVQEQQIDIIHQPIPVSPKDPSMIFGMGVPVVMGPMNGGMNYPPAFRHMESRFINLSVKMGRLFANLFNSLIPGKRKATTLLVANQRTKEALPKGFTGKVIELVENGVDLSIWKPKSQNRSLGLENPVQFGRNNLSVVSRETEEQERNFSRATIAEETTTQQLENSEKRPQQPTKFVFVGRLIDLKAVDLLILAFKRVVEQIPVELEIIGDGTERPLLEAQAKELGLIKFQNTESTSQDSGGKTEEGELLHFAGWLSQAECAQRLQLADVMVLPSLHECGGAVVLEAMTMGLPVIATNWGGPADYLNESCGILIEPASRDSFINDLASAMLTMAQSSQFRYKLGIAGRQRVLDHFDWEKKVDTILKIYQESIERYEIN